MRERKVLCACVCVSVCLYGCLSVCVCEREWGEVRLGNGEMRERGGSEIMDNGRQRGIE